MNNSPQKEYFTMIFSTYNKTRMNKRNYELTVKEICTNYIF